MRLGGVKGWSYRHVCMPGMIGVIFGLGHFFAFFIFNL